MDLEVDPPFLWSRSVVELLELKPFGWKNLEQSFFFFLIWSYMELCQICPMPYSKQ